MERLSSSNKKKVYYGLDVLKFFMAFIVVMIHVKPFPSGTLLFSAFSPLLAVAVPVFLLSVLFCCFPKYMVWNVMGCICLLFNDLRKEY